MEVDKGLFSKNGKIMILIKIWKDYVPNINSLVNEGISKMSQSLKEFKVLHIDSQIKST